VHAKHLALTPARQPTAPIAQRAGRKQSFSASHSALSDDSSLSSGPEGGELEETTVTGPDGRTITVTYRGVDPSLPKGSKEYKHQKRLADNRASAARSRALQRLKLNETGVRHITRAKSLDPSRVTAYTRAHLHDLQTKVSHLVAEIAALAAENKTLRALLLAHGIALPSTVSAAAVRDEEEDDNDTIHRSDSNRSEASSATAASLLSLGGASISGSDHPVADGMMQAASSLPPGVRRGTSTRGCGHRLRSTADAPGSGGPARLATAAPCRTGGPFRQVIPPPPPATASAAPAPARPGNCGGSLDALLPLEDGEEDAAACSTSGAFEEMFGQQQPLLRGETALPTSSAAARPGSGAGQLPSPAGRSISGAWFVPLLQSALASPPRAGAVAAALAPVGATFSRPGPDLALVRFTSVVSEDAAGGLNDALVASGTWVAYPSPPPLPSPAAAAGRKRKAPHNTAGGAAGGASRHQRLVDSDVEEEEEGEQPVDGGSSLPHPLPAKRARQRSGEGGETQAPLWAAAEDAEASLAVSAGCGAATGGVAVRAPWSSVAMLALAVAVAVCSSSGTGSEGCGATDASASRGRLLLLDEGGHGGEGAGEALATPLPLAWQLAALCAMLVCWAAARCLQQAAVASSTVTKPASGTTGGSSPRAPHRARRRAFRHLFLDSK